MEKVEPKRVIKRRNRQATEAKLLQALEASLAERGVEKTGINRVAQDSGCNKVLIYRYFGGMNGLLLGVHNRFWTQVMGLAREMPLGDKQTLLLLAYYQQMWERPGTQQLY